MPMPKAHKEERVKHNKIYGKHSSWEVFTHNLFKLICVDMLSRSFVVLVGSITVMGWFLYDQIKITQSGISWLELAVSVTVPAFFAFYWVERRRATEILEMIAEGVKSYFSNKK